MRFDLSIYARFENNGPFVERRGNIGIGGFCMEGNDYIPGNTVELLFQQPALGLWIHTTGEVLGTAPGNRWPAVRGKFIFIDPSDLQILTEWIKNMTFESENMAVA